MGKAWKMALYVSVVSFIFALYTSMYLPIKDYRAYAIGNNLKEQMSNGIEPVIDMKLNYKNLQTGEIEAFGVDQWEIYMDTAKYEFVDRKDVVIDAGKDASIMDFRPSLNFEDLSESDKKNPYIDSLVQADYWFYYEEKMAISSEYGVDTIVAMDFDTLYYPDSMYTASEPFVSLSDPTMPWEIDMTPYILEADFIFLMTIRDYENMNESALPDLLKVMNSAKENKIPFFILTTAIQAQVDELRNTHGFDTPVLQIDGTEVKILVRSNPGLLLLQKGTVLDKWPSRSIPDFDSIFEDYIQGK